MTYRTADLDPDYRRDPKTNDYCGRCQRDLKPGQARRWIAYELDTHRVIHPEDFGAATADIMSRRTCLEPVVIDQIGSDCALKVGLEFTWADRPRVEK